MSPGRITWIASYPKSGNTWMRAFVSNLLRNSDAPAEINTLEASLHAASRPLVEAIAGVETSELRPEETDRLRPLAFAALAESAAEPLCVKIHDALWRTPDGMLVTPPQATAGALYMLRNPLDVAVSYAPHTGRTIDDIIDRMANPHFRMGRPGGWQLPQRLGSWSDHVTGWADTDAIRVAVFRFEDLKARTVESFTAAARFAGLPSDEPVIRKALGFSSFEELRRQERAHGFAERGRHARAFFREGRAGGWRATLTDAQVDRITAVHESVMRRFGYLDANGDPTPDAA
jgi:hypothetical protein